MKKAPANAEAFQLRGGDARAEYRVSLAFERRLVA
jgi:hypothetical protein